MRKTNQEENIEMNAYELAEIMEIHDGSLIWEHGLDIANMLRKQADEIGSLTARLKQQADLVKQASQFIQEQGLERQWIVWSALKKESEK